MIIEDDLIIAENLKENLEELGYEVAGIATHHKEAISLFENTQPDLCLTDIHLRGSKKNGIEIIQEMNIGHKIPIIYLTSFTDTEFREKAKTTNPVSYLIKPASKEQIDVSIDMALSIFNKSSLKSTSLENSEFFYVKVKSKYEKICTEDITHLQAEGSYCQIYTHEMKYTASINLKNLLAQLVNSNLTKCHRSYAVNIEKVHSFTEEILFINHKNDLKEISVSNTYRKEILSKLPKIKTD